MQEQLEQTRSRLESLSEISQLLMRTVEPDDLIQVILESAIRLFKVFATVRNANVASQEVIQDRYRLAVGPSVTTQEVLRLTRTLAAINTTVLLLGESGTGKEVVARAIHQWSPRAHHPFAAVNCVALTPELLESELFGHEKGAFTGAIAQRKGRFELAEGGTIFLDEIGELAPHLQVKLLRVLQEKEFQKEDIPVLVQHFLDRSCREMKRAPMGIERTAMELLQSYPWPGNVRELQNVIERAVVLSPGPEITASDLPVRIRQPAASSGGVVAQIQVMNGVPPLAKAMDEFKLALIRKALEAAAGNQTRAAKLLGLQQSNLSRMMKALGIRQSGGISKLLGLWTSPPTPLPEEEASNNNNQQNKCS